jgi:hypothetical protein
MYIYIYIYFEQHKCFYLLHTITAVSDYSNTYIYALYSLFVIEIVVLVVGKVTVVKHDKRER